ncbi:MAG TPA: hypothetical protein VHS53_01915, partial [Mucilaginibacter sp.]|nr:hypothetical protein [Mucilaginibacter sp.]
MAYYRIGKHNVFYSDDRFKEINKPFLDTLSPSDAITLNILGVDGKPSKNAIELETLRVKTLKDDHNSLNKHDFIRKWVEFDFTGGNVHKIAWEVIYDYFHLN